MTKDEQREAALAADKSGTSTLETIEGVAYRLGYRNGFDLGHDAATAWTPVSERSPDERDEALRVLAEIRSITYEHRDDAERLADIGELAFDALAAASSVLGEGE